MNGRPNPLVVQILERGKALGMTRAEITCRAGIYERAFDHWYRVGRSPSLSHLEAAAGSVGLRVVLLPTDDPAPDAPDAPDEISLEAIGRARRRAAGALEMLEREIAALRHKLSELAIDKTR